jgi:dihydrofolate reductase
MSLAVLFMSVSVDGYIAGPDDFLGGSDGERLHHWFSAGGSFGEVAESARDLLAEIESPGAVVTGRRTAELMDHWGGNLHGVPIFVVSHRPPGPAGRWSYDKVTYVADIAEAIAQAKAAAGGRDVRVGGGTSTMRQYLRAGLVDEAHLAFGPVLLGSGEALFPGLDLAALGYRVAEQVQGERALHVILRRG